MKKVRSIFAVILVMATLFTIGSPIPGLSAAGADPGVQPLVIVHMSAFDFSGTLYNDIANNHFALGDYALYIYPNYTSKRVVFDVYGGPVSTSSTVTIKIGTSAGSYNIVDKSQYKAAGDNDLAGSETFAAKSNVKYFFEISCEMGVKNSAKGHGKISFSGTFYLLGDTLYWDYT